MPEWVVVEGDDESGHSIHAPDVLGVIAPAGI
jgi:hypothetical protein